ncbi:MAG: aminotransferase class I/II-fold pyridoxal phosphate-dependent enzyme [Bacteroidota bacterium]|nr:aminotransferase class I/II-fold pyridoxal phosphate-dependent enzyme [Bacteroidota bacterium]MDP3145976.1 aminotransferase class I/II-fold pyridoxal phosphate-dependent enzyme [Bacteroidota bacterium]
MSKYKFNKYINTIDECLTNGVKNGIFQVTIEDTFLDGRLVKIGGKHVVNFGSCSYLGLEMDNRICESGKKAFDNFGSQFSASRLFASCGLYETAESLLSEMFFNAPVIIAPSTTLAHIGAIPILIEDTDLIILDHQAHGSMQMAVQLPKSRGVPVLMIRHNNLIELENLLIENRNKYSKIWHFIDGSYSMYGDFAPIKDLENLLNKYDNFYLYADDAHGMSWTGINGTGYVLSQIKLHPKMVLTTSLNKAFATGGGLLVLPNEELKRKILTCGTSFTFSGPLQPSTLGAIVASAKIHLSEDINELQNKLNERTKYALELINNYKLPLLAPSESPIFYLPLGLPRVGYNMVKKLLNDGFYTNIGIFPGVPVKCTGLRLAIANGQSKEDIKNVIEAFSYHFPKVLEEESQSIEDISNYFNVDFNETAIRYPLNRKNNDNLNIQLETSIKNISKAVWNELLGDNGSFDWEGCLFLEEAFKDNPEPENNWKYHYLIIKDEYDKPILATFFTELICKDDMISPASVSIKIEEMRKQDKYYLTSKIIMMGSLLTEGDHLYIDRQSQHWQTSILKMLAIMNEVKIKANASAIQLRDFDSNDLEMRDFLLKEGFIRVEMPDTHVIENITWNNEEEFLLLLSHKRRYYFKKEILLNKESFSLNYYGENSSVSKEKIIEWYNLYLNVKNKSYNLNTFTLPFKLFENMVQNKNWEVIELRFNNELFNFKEIHDSTLSIIFCYKSVKSNYCPMIIGLDYQYNNKYFIYRQSLFQIIKRSKDLNFNSVYLGMEASIEKQKIKAKPIQKSMYFQADENYNQEIITLLKT